jgi:polyphosphate kinase 2 (PPK2 family)
VVAGRRVDPAAGVITASKTDRWTSERLFRQVAGFERSLVESGIHLLKLGFAVSAENQEQRFEQRRTDPLRQWKLSPMDAEAVERYGEYGRARASMLVGTDHPAYGAGCGGGGG